MSPLILCQLTVVEHCHTAYSDHSIEHKRDTVFSASACVDFLVVIHFIPSQAVT